VVRVVAEVHQNNFVRSSRFIDGDRLEGGRPLVGRRPIRWLENPDLGAFGEGRKDIGGIVGHTGMNRRQG
jgi:hypothetical protein